VRERRQRKVSTIAVVAAAFAASISANAASATDRVTLELDRVYDPDCYCYRLRFRGVIAPPAPNKYVAVTQRKCGLNFATSVAGASTRADGSWMAKSAVPVSSSATYRARSGDRLSKPVVVRPRMRVQLTKLGPERYRVGVSTADAQQNMAGRFIELQRLAAGSWVLVRRERLTADPRAVGSFAATFRVRTRGLRMRTVVPAKSAAPCFTTGVSQTFYS
jgi:hypothetical protein